MQYDCFTLFNILVTIILQCPTSGWVLNLKLIQTLDHFRLNIPVVQRKLNVTFKLGKQCTTTLKTNRFARIWSSLASLN